MTIRVVLTSKNGVDCARASIAGREVTVRSRKDPVCELARLLDQSAPDCAIEAYSPEGSLLLTYQSARKAARYTMSEGVAGESYKRWHPFDRDRAELV